MARSHPPSVITQARRALLDECGVVRGARVLLAVSGGMDSMCLLHVLAQLRQPLGLELFAHGVDHGLRAEAVAELDVAQRLAQQLGVEFSRSALSLGAGGNLQERAREARYVALRGAAERCGATLIATAHHADDRAETVVLRLLRGAGPTGLAVLPARAAGRIRPLIRVRRAQIARHVERHCLEFCEDPSNRDRRFLRSQVRHELMPLLERMSPGVVGHLNALADALRVELDGTAAPAPLGRAQLQALQAAVRSGAVGASIRLSEALELRLERTLAPRRGGNRRGG